MIINISDRLKNKISTAFNGTEVCVFTPSCVLHNPNTGYKHTFNYVRDIVFVQDFIVTYMDTIQIVLDFKISEYKEMVQNSQDLECSLILKPKVSRGDNTGENVNQDPIILEMMAYLDNGVDVDKQINPNAVGKTDDPDTVEQANLIVQEALHLIDKTAHDMRQIQLNTILKDATLEDALYWACQNFQAENVDIVPPDNKETYNALIVPPMQDIGSLIPFLQERYGVYAKDISYYYTDDHFYVYPIFDTKQETSPVDGIIHLIAAPANSFMGLPRYHTGVDDDVYIVTASNVKMDTLNSRGSENVGTSHMSVNADSMHDQYVKIGKDGKVKRNSDDITTISSQNDAAKPSSTMQNVKYTGEKTNIYSSTSALAAYNGTILTASWMRAYPGLIKPGQNVIYHYDGADGEYCTQNGRILNVRYTSSTISSDDSVKPDIIFAAALQIFLDPDVSSEDEVQYR